MNDNLRDELSFLNDSEPTQSSNDYGNQTTSSNQKGNSQLENFFEKERVIRLIIEKWKVDELAGTEQGKKSVVNKEDVLKAIIYNWKI